MKHIGNITYEIVGIDLLDSYIKAPTKLLPNTSTSQLELALEHNIAIKQNLVFVNCSIAIMDSKKETTYGNISSSCTFEFNNLQPFFDGKKVDLPPEIVSNINEIAFSTTRGMMFSLCRGTYLHSAVLPIIDLGAISKKARNN